MDTRTLLETLPDVYARLEDALHGNRRGETERTSGGGGNDRPMPLQGQVAEHRDQVRHDLRWWVSHYARPVQPVGDSVPHMCALLLEALGRLTEDDEQALHETVRDLHRKARALTDLPQVRGQLPLGDCLNADGDLWRCDGALFAVLPDPSSRTPVFLRCRECGGRWDVTDLPQARDVRVPIGDAAAMLGVHHYTLRRVVGKGQTHITLGAALAVTA